MGDPDAWPERNVSALFGIDGLYAHRPLLRASEYCGELKRRTRCHVWQSDLKLAVESGLIRPVVVRAPADASVESIEFPVPRPRVSRQVAKFGGLPRSGTACFVDGAKWCAADVKSTDPHGSMVPYFSWYQLLDANATIAALRESRSSPPDPQHLAALTDGLLHQRRLAMTLDILDIQYRPLITHLLHEPDLWDEIQAPPDATLRLLEVDAEALLRQAEFFQLDSRGLDFGGRWSELIDMGAPSTWTRLQGEAAQAHELRFARELLLMLHDSLVSNGHAVEPIPPDEPFHPLRKRLGRRLNIEPRATLEELLHELGCSPHPTVVMAVEGETERRMFLRVFAMIDPHQELSRHVETVDFKGVGNDTTSWPDTPGCRAWVRSGLTER